MANERILLVDDDDELRKAVCSCLELENMKVTQLDNGYDVMNILQRNSFDLVILDLVLKDLDGFEILKDIRHRFETLPVIVLSAKKTLNNKVLGLGLGADDYITKPFCEDELIARIKSHIRRVICIHNSIQLEKKFLYYDSLKLDVNSFKLHKNDKEIKLNARLFKLVRYFMENPDRVISKRQIYEHVWDDAYYDENTIMVYIRNLRKLIEDNPDKPSYIHTVWGMGYKLSHGKD